MRTTKFLSTLSILVLLLTACGEVEVTATPEVLPYPVTVTKAASRVTTTIRASGMVEGKNSTVVIAPAAGVVSELFVREGTRVSAGTPLFRIGGANGAPHPLETQMKVAFTQANSAINSYNITAQSNQVALSGAYLGYYSAVNQTQASQLDQQVLTINRSQLESTVAKLSEALTNLYAARQATDDATQIAALEKQIQETQSGITQAQTQIRVSELSQQSVIQKTGLTDNTSFAQQQSMLQIPTTQLRNEGSISQARTQAELARSSYEVAKTQYESLVVRAQSSGVVTGFDLAVGSPVSPQVPSATIINNGLLTADVGVNEEDAYRINAKSAVAVRVGDEYKPTRIVAISPTVDTQSKKVMITIAIPANTIRVNGVADVLFSVEPLASKSSVIYVPLDSVIVSTEETFVFVVDGSVAHKRTVKRGEIVQDTVEILEGLNENDVVILDGAKNVFDGQTVSIQQ